MKLLSFPAKQTKAPPVKDVVELLETALEQAKTGEIQAIFLIGISATENMLSAWADRPDGNAYLMIGAISYGLYEYQKTTIQED